MTATKKEFLAALLKELNQTAGIEGSAIVSREGLLVVSCLPNAVDAETLGALSATMFCAAETASRGLRAEDMERVIVESGSAKIVAVGAGRSFILVSLAGPDASLGLVLMEIRKAAVCIEDSVN